MFIMTILKIMFVILLCVPLGYICIRFFVQLVDSLKEETKKKRKRT